MPLDSQKRQQLATPTRVQINYEPETFGEEPITELPFVVGVMADLSGMPAPGTRKPLKNRDFVPITKESFGKVMEGAGARVALRVPNRLTEDADQELNVELHFKAMSDFDPGRVAEQVPALNEILTMRRQLTALLQKLDGNDELEKLLKEVIDNSDKLQALAAARAPSA